MNEPANSDPETTPAEQSADEATTAPAAKRRKKSDNPFDYPFVFSGLLLAIALWFGYDGWLNPKTESIMFNRIVFVLFFVGFLFTAWVDWRMVNRKKNKATPPSA